MNARVSCPLWLLFSDVARFLDLSNLESTMLFLLIEMMAKTIEIRAVKQTKSLKSSIKMAICIILNLITLMTS